MQPDFQMPAASLPLPLERLLRLIPSVLGLLAVLLRPPPTASRVSPLALPLPPFVPGLATFALRPVAFLASPSNHRYDYHVPPQPTPPPCPTPARRTLARGLLPRPLGESWGEGLPFEASPCSPAAPSRRRAVPTAPQNPPKSAPRLPKSFLEKTLSAREAPYFARFSRSRQQPNCGSARCGCLGGAPRCRTHRSRLRQRASRLLRPRWEGTGCAVEAAQPQTSADRPWPSAPKHPFSSQEPTRLAVELPKLPSLVLQQTARGGQHRTTRFAVPSWRGARSKLPSLVL